MNNLNIIPIWISICSALLCLLCLFPACPSLFFFAHPPATQTGRDCIELGHVFRFFLAAPITIEY